MPASSKLLVKNQAITAAMIGIMKWINADKIRIATTPMITRIITMINSPNPIPEIKNALDI
jgi:hypothetical protein